MADGLAAIDDCQHQSSVLGHSNGAPGSSTVAYVPREILLGCCDVYPAVFHEAGACAHDLHRAVPRLAQILLDFGGVTDAHLAKRAYGGSVDGDDCAVRRDFAVSGVHCCHVPVLNDELQAELVRAGPLAVPAIVDHEIVLAALRIDGGDWERHTAQGDVSVIVYLPEYGAAVLQKAERAAVEVGSPGHDAINLCDADHLAARSEI